MKNILFFAVLAAVFSTSAAIRSVTPAVWGRKHDTWQQPRHLQKLELAKKGGEKIVFIGDSITHFWESRGKKQLEKYFTGESKMLNLGFSADRTEHVLWRIENGELDGFEAKAVFLMIGTNNTGHYSFDKEPPSDTILGIRAVVNKIREKQPKACIVLCGIFPRGADCSDACRIRNDIVNAEIKKFCDNKTLIWCDFSDLYLEKDGTLPRKLFPDLLHPSAEGYEIWYAAIKPYIEAALSGGTKPFPKNRDSLFKSKPSILPVAATPATRIRTEGYGKKDWWLDRLFQRRTQISNCGGNYDVVFLGDSITHGWEKQSGKGEYNKLLKKYSILNAGYSGDRTQHVLWRIQNGELEGYKAKCFMLMIGTNNRNDKAEDVAKGISEILSVIAKKHPDAKTLLLPIFPRGEGVENSLRKKNEAVNSIIRKYADGEKVIWVDFNDKLIDAKGDTKWIMPDRLHLNPQGYKIWLDAVTPHFERICGK